MEKFNLELKNTSLEDVNIVTEDDIQKALKKAFGALSTEKERREGKRVIIQYMRENNLKALDFEDPDTGKVKRARFFEERTTVAFDQKILKEKFPDIYKQCLTTQTKAANVWIDEKETK